MGIRLTIKCILLVLAFQLSSVHFAFGQEAPEASPTPTGEEKNDATLNSMFGQTVGSDYVAKHFSLIFGVIVLDPFDFNSPTPAPSNGQGAGEDSSSSGASTPKQFFLDDGGDPEVRAFLEGGVRYRWAWLDRLGVGAIPADGKRDHACPSTLTKIEEGKDTLETAAKARKVAEDKVEETEARIAELVDELTDDAPPRGANARAELASLRRDLRVQKKAVEEAKENEKRAEEAVEAAEDLAEKDTKRYYERQWKLSQEGVPVQLLCSMWQRRRPVPSHCPDDVSTAPVNVDPNADDWDLQWWWSRCLLPGDFQARVGYVFDGGSPAGLSSLASGSNVYGDLIGGINLIRASMPTSSPEETPVRASVNLEGLISLTTDTDSVDVHGRYLVGPALAVGVPLLRLPQPANDKGGDDEKDDADDEKDDADRDDADTKNDSKAADSSDLPKPGGIVEMVARLGAVNIDVPSFKNHKTREVETENDLPDFSGEWGLGLDLELNIPIAERAGYITARASINEFITPAPWGVQLGYTIPLSTLTGLVTGGQNGD
jgi:hypothetical protein